jgi:hypothetical protein
MWGLHIIMAGDAFALCAEGAEQNQSRRREEPRQGGKMSNVVMSNSMKRHRVGG